MRAHRAGVGALVLLALAGCGSSGASKTPKVSGDAAVVDAWSKAVRDHDYKKAADLFALPSTIENGVRVRARHRADVDIFNRSLSCGAILTGTTPTGAGRLLATFRLVRGPGGACKGKAQVRFRIQKGHITEWIRLDSGPPPDSVET